jgi:hypothetical protein
MPPLILSSDESGGGNQMLIFNDPKLQEIISNEIYDAFNLFNQYGITVRGYDIPLGYFDTMWCKAYEITLPNEDTKTFAKYILRVMHCYVEMSLYENDPNFDEERFKKSTKSNGFIAFQLNAVNRKNISELTNPNDAFIKTADDIAEWHINFDESKLKNRLKCESFNNDLYVTIEDLIESGKYKSEDIDQLIKHIEIIGKFISNLVDYLNTISN